MTAENKTSGVSVNDKNDDEILKQQEDEFVFYNKSYYKKNYLQHNLGVTFIYKHRYLHVKTNCKGIREERKMMNILFVFTCNREILVVHVNPWAYPKDSNDVSAGDDDEDDAWYADVCGHDDDGYDGRLLLFDDANDGDDVEQQRQHFAHALLQQLQQILHRHPL